MFDLEATRERLDKEVGRSGDEHRLDSHGAIGLQHFDRARIQMAYQHAVAILLAEFPQAVA